MSIGGFFVRSLGAGPGAVNQGEAAALESMRNQQRFADEQEARRLVYEKEMLEDSSALPTMPQLVAPPPLGIEGTMMAAYQRNRVAAPTPTPTPTPAAAPAAAPVVPFAGLNVDALGQGAAYVTSAASAVAPTKETPEQLAARKNAFETTKQALARSTETINRITQEIDILKNIGRSGMPWREQVQKYGDIGERTRRREELEQILKLQKAEQAKYAAELSRLNTLGAPVEAFPQLYRTAPTLVTPAGTPSAAARALAPVPKFIADQPAGQFSNFAQAVMMAESAGDPKAVSPKGAVGRMQVMPATLKDPGFGIRPAQNDSDAERERVGVEYLAAMLQKFKDPTHALVAYNAGPAFAEEWISKGAKTEDLPKETRDYIDRVNINYARQATGTGTGAQLGVPQTAASNAILPPAEQAQDRDYTAALPIVGNTLNRLVADRQELVRQANEAQSRGIPGVRSQLIAQIKEIDNQLILVQGLASLGDIAVDPTDTRRFSGVMSIMYGQDPGYYQLQLRSDGLYNEVVNGRVTNQGLTKQDIIYKGRMAFDSGFAAAVTETQKKQAETQITLASKLAELEAQSGFKLQEILVQGQVDALKEQLKGDYSYAQAMDTAKLAAQAAGKKTVEPKFYNGYDASGQSVTLAIIGNNFYQVTQSRDQSGTLSGPVKLVQIMGASLMPGVPQ